MLKPHVQTPDLANELDLLSRTLVSQLRKLVPWLGGAVRILIGVLALLAMVFAAVVAYDVLAWSGLLSMSVPRLDVYHDVSAKGALWTIFVGVGGAVWQVVRRRRKRGRDARPKAPED